MARPRRPRRSEPGDDEPEVARTFEDIEKLRADGAPPPKYSNHLPQHIRDLAGEYTEEAVLFYAKYARDESLPVTVRKSCYDELMNRKWGKPKDEDHRSFDGVLTINFVEKPKEVTDVVAHVVDEVRGDLPKLLDAAKSETIDAEIVPDVVPA